MVLWEEGCVAGVLEEPNASIFRVSKPSWKIHVMLGVEKRGQGCLQSNGNCWPEVGCFKVLMSLVLVCFVAWFVPLTEQLFKGQWFPLTSAHLQPLAFAVCVSGTIFLLGWFSCLEDEASNTILFHPHFLRTCLA
jgi:hypothetical protein